jgi:diguanylate cyclase (GGDEF)-like protein
VTRRPERRLYLLAAILAVLAALEHVMLPAHASPPAGRLVGPAALLFVFFLAAESSQIHVELRRQTHSLSFSELPLVLGLFLLPPLWLVAVRLSAAGIVFLLRRAPAPKALFNLGLFAAEVETGAIVFRSVRNGEGLGPPDWTAAYAAMLVVSLLGATAVTAGITVLQGAPTLRELLRTLGLLSVTAVFNTTLGLVAVLCLTYEGAWVLLVLLLVLAVVVYRVYDRLLREHAHLGQLFTFTQSLARGGSTEDILRRLMSEARELLQAETAQLHRLDPPAPGVEGVPAPVLAAAPLVAPRHTRDRELRAWLDRTRARDAVLVPLQLHEDCRAVLQVSNRLGTMRTFDKTDLHLLQTLTTHGELTWHRGRLLERERYDAHHDALTGLGNRVLFLQQLDRVLAVHVAARQLSPPPAASPTGAVFLLDVDRFKDVNDTLGHHAGDLLLKQVAARLLATAPPAAAVARLGGDEFAVLVPECASPQEACRVAHEVRTSLSGAFEVAGTSLEVGVSIGVAIVPDDGSAPPEVLQHADIAMYEAKHSVRGVVRYRAADAQRTRRRLELAGELRNAIGTAQLSVHYQPKMRLSDGVITGCEALARWEHPSLGQVSPDEFVPVAEQTGLITCLSLDVLEEALRRCRLWQRSHPGLGIAVNLSTRDLRDRKIMTNVARLLQAAKVEPSLLTLEITESSVLGDISAALASLHALKSLGLKLSLDDFGTGYSSLTYLQRLPVDEVKIDKSFVTTMATSRRASVIVRSVIELAHNVGLDVVAEGVEDEASREALRTMGCDTVQGYLVSSPLPHAGVTALITGRSEHEMRPAG